MCRCCVCCVNKWVTNEYNDYDVNILLISMSIWDRYGGDIVSMSIDDRVNGSGWLVFVWVRMNEWMNESCIE